jgi:hypothetical protein
VTDASVRYPAHPVSVAHDASTDEVYVATRGGIFRTRIADPPLPFVEVPGGAMPPGGAARLAPGGGLAIRSIVGPAGEQIIEIASLAPPGTATDVPPLSWTAMTPPATGTTLRGAYASPGWRGAQLMLYRPVNDRSGHSGPWAWTFHDVNGRFIGSMTTDDERPFSRGSSGSVVAFRFRDRIEVRGPTIGTGGTVFDVIHTVPGRYRFQTVSGGGEIVIAADADFRRRIVVSTRGGARRRIDIGAVVHGASLSPAGRVALVWRRDGLLHVFEPRGGSPGAAMRLAFPYVNVTSAHVRDDGLVTLSLAVRDAAAPSGFSSRIVQLRSGRVLWSRAHTPSRVTRRIPRILHAELDEVILHDFEAITRLGAPPRGPGGGP